MISKRNLSLIAAILVPWLWIARDGLARLPVGGDATRFGIGLMSDLTRSPVSELRVPLWNSLWGYGFPALAESQLGVFYPPHLVLFSTLSLEWAYWADGVTHATWASLGAWVLAAALGRGPGACLIAAIAFVISGFFLVHEPHHWAFPTTSWMPWIWWAFLRTADSAELPTRVRLRRSLTLAAVAAMPVLTGHFQMGFVALVTGSLAAFTWILMRPMPDPAGSRRFAAVNAMMLLTLAGSFAAGIAAVQVLPTAELAGIADRQFDWEYLSGFATPPTHWIHLIAPSLGRIYPLWRPLLWDQFHTSPEESFFYVGLVPLWLACAGVIQSWTSDFRTRVLVVVLGVSLLLAAGPYGFGFSWLIALPGFSFFRAPARWTAAASLALAMLSAIGWDSLLRQPDTAARSMRRFTTVALLVLLMSTAALEFVIRNSIDRRGGDSSIIAFVDSARRFLMPPWNDVGSVSEWVLRSAAVSPATLPAYVKPFTNLDGARLTTDRLEIYISEIGPHAVPLLLMFLASFFVKNSVRRAACVAILVMGVDIVIVSRLRSIETETIAPLESHSPLLARLGEISSESDWPAAVVGDLGNLPMAVGASPLKAYRTLDVPVMPMTDTLSADPVGAEASPMTRLAGAGVIVLDPPSWERIKGRWHPAGTVEEIDDPNLWSWLTTREAARRTPSTFALVRINEPTGRAWRVPASSVAGGMSALAQATRPAAMERIAEAAEPLLAVRRRPERLEISAEAKGPELWLICQWADPNWKATLTSPEGDAKEVEIIPLEGGWQGVAVPSAGSWLLEMSYRPRSFVAGGLISTVAIFAWGICLIVCVRPRQRVRSASQTHDEP